MAGGICVANVFKTDDGARGTLQLRVYGDATEAIALASQHFYTSGFQNIWVPMASTGIPVPAGKLFEVRADVTNPDPSFGCRYAQFDAAAPGLGDWVQLVTNNKPAPAVDAPTLFQKTASSDGFLLASIDCSATDGARGYIELQHTDGQNFTRVAGATAQYYTVSNRYVPWNSFCVPIRNGTVWQLAYETTSTGANFNAWWIPFTSNVFQESVPATSAQQATSDGFLSGWVRAENDGDRGYLRLWASPTQNHRPIGMEASASAHYYTTNDMHVRTNSAMIPVKEGWWYQVTQTPTWGKPSFSVRFTPATNLFTAAS